MPNITINNQEYDLDQFSAEAKAQLANLQFVDAEIQRRENQLAVLRTARITYGRAFQRELKKLEAQSAPKQ